MKTNKLPPMKRIKDQKYYLENVDIEAEIMTKAISIAERMVAAMLRERTPSFEIDIDDLANKISKKLNITKYENGPNKTYKELRATDQFSFDDEPSIVKTEDYEISGNIAKKSKTKDSTDDALDALLNLDL